VGALATLCHAFEAFLKACMQSVLLALLLLAAIKLCWWHCFSWLLPLQLA
jgi:hypothetical protein